MTDMLMRAVCAVFGHVAPPTWWTSTFIPPWERPRCDRCNKRLAR